MITMIKEAINVIKKNDRGGFTIPTNRLYPHQWNWDSGFTALGISSLGQIKSMARISYAYQCTMDKWYGSSYNIS